jgi:HTH-type transcriptional regulator, sugar sensing transcriptional regulator
MFEKFLEDLGLSDKESKVYLALLEVENDSVIDLAKKTNINRTTIYPVLESLSKKGLVSEVKIDKKIRYSAESPDRLETYIEKRKIQLDEQSKRLVDLVPQLKSIKRESGEKPIIKVFEGKEGILMANEDFIKNADDKDHTIFAIYPKDEIDELFNEKDLIKFKSIRLNKKIKSKSVFTYEKGEYLSNPEANRMKLDKNLYPLKCDISVYKDYVKVSTLGSSFYTILIKSIDVADTLKSLVNYIHDHK